MYELPYVVTLSGCGVFVQRLDDEMTKQGPPGVEFKVIGVAPAPVPLGGGYNVFLAIPTQDERRMLVPRLAEHARSQVDRQACDQDEQPALRPPSQDYEPQEGYGTPSHRCPESTRALRQ